MTHFLFRGRLLGGHVHVDVWAGSAAQRELQARPRLGTLIMDPDQWRAFQALVDEGEFCRAAVAEFEQR